MSVMKKLRIILIVIVFCLVMINILKNNIDPSLSGLALSNIEALAGEECTTHWSCWLNLAYIIHSGFISGYQNRYGDNLKPPTNVYHRMTA